MVENGFDPALVAYAGGAIALLLVIKMFFFQKKNIAEIADQEKKTKASAEDKAPSTKSSDSSASQLPSKAQTEEAASPEINVVESEAAVSSREVEPGAEVAQPVAEQQSSTATASEVDAQEKAEEKLVPASINESTIVQPEPEPEPVAIAAVEPEVKQSFFAKVKQGLSKTKAGMSRQMGDLLLGAKEIDEELLEDLETILITSDLGIQVTSEIIGRLTEQVDRSELKDPKALHNALKIELSGILQAVEKPLQLDDTKEPYVILMVGVNGVGKTTTIGKLAKKFQSEGKSVMLAAGDTFRAAAVEQLQVWGERNDVPVVAQHTGADSASVLFDAVQSAKAKGVDVLIADTAGRLQNKDNLMQELQKVIRVMQKLDATAPHEVMLVLDAGTGQNGLSQAQVFGEAVGVTGITLTKLDGTAKGGIIFAIAKSLSLPIRFIGVGEQVDDLQPFVADQFVSALFDQDGER
ncbi:MAG: signal recognition particle receptor FtsY [Osedax symbiont Rs2]|nr:MAG: signal recognition particle receptor FtsY [Osedax symbiont Rs2]